MAIWINPENVVYSFKDGCLSFPEWIAETPERTAAWEAAVVEHNAWLAANPGVPVNTARGSAGNIHQEWLDYSGAVELPFVLKS